jgi:hypothetical protein
MKARSFPTRSRRKTMLPPRSRTTADLLRDWEGLLRACKANGRSLPDLTDVLETLEDALIRMKTLGSLREVVANTAQDTTKQLKQTREAGSESARRLRSYLKAQLGSTGSLSGVPGRARRSSRPRSSSKLCPGAG